MTVLHVLDHSLPIISGYSARSRSIVTFEAKLGLRPVVVTSPKHIAPGPAREVVDGIPHYRTRGSRTRLAKRPYAAELHLMRGTAVRLAQVARAEGARIVHAHSPVLNGIPALWVGRRLGLPVVYEARAFWEDAAVDRGVTRETGLRYRLTRALESFLFRRVDRVVTIAAAMQRELIQRGVEPGRITVVPNGVDTARFRPGPRSHALADRLGLDGGPVFGFIGSFYGYEGLAFLLEALPAVRATVPRLSLLLVGAGHEEPALRATAARLDARVVFAGQVPPDDVRDFYSVTDVFVYPRRRMRLTELVTPLKPLEAMAMGRAVLASDVGGLRELITHEVTGLLFPAESRASLVQAACRLAGAPELRARLGSQARETMVNERTWQSVVSRYLPLYSALV